MPIGKLRLPRIVKEGLTQWAGLADALYRLWLESGSYEAWAKRQLMDPAGEVNELGLLLIRGLNRSNPAWYWWFQDESRHRLRPTKACPRCSGTLVTLQRGRECRRCRIYVEP